MYDLAGGKDDTGELAEEPPAWEGGEGGEGGCGEAHHRVGEGHVAHEQVDPRVKAGGSAELLGVSSLPLSLMSDLTWLRWSQSRGFQQFP